MAHVMNSGHNPHGPFGSTVFVPTKAHGWVPTNTWYAPVPFNSAPPPVPTGVNPQTWMNGQWQQNPFFQPQPGMAHGTVQSWAPHPGWAAVAQNYNPYKRIPNPGDASYWATKLSDNPLGLENMHIRDDTPANERHLKDESNGVPHTPWMWVPKELSREASKSAHEQNPSGSQGSQIPAQQTEKELPIPPSHASRDHSRHNSGSRHIYEVTSQPRPAERAAPVSAPAAISSYSAYHQQQQRQQESQRPSDRYHSSSQQQQQQPDPPQHRPRQRSRDVSPRPPSDPSSYPARDYRSYTTSSASSSASAASTAVRSATTPTPARDRDRDNDDGYGHVVFSPNIIRTPDHYSTPPSRRMSHDDVERTPSRTPAPPHGNIYAPAKTPSRSNSLSTRRQTSTPSSTSTSTSTTPSSSQLGLLTFTEEPQALLSPLVVGSTPPSNQSSPGREVVSRSQSHPTVGFYSLPEERDHKVYPRTPLLYEAGRSRDRELEREWNRERDANITPQPPPQRTPPNGRTPPSSQYTRPSPETGSHHSRQISRSLTYPMVAPPVNIGSPPSTSPHYGTSNSHHAQTYPPPSSYPSYPNRTSPNANSARSRGTSPLRHNPLPRPPAVSAYTESLTRGSSSASAAAAAHQQSTAKRIVRKGFWNSRGDHLYVTDSGCFIVYAPTALANPEELKGYPSPLDGWLNHFGERLKYDPNVPELLDSLPRQGKDPVMPYRNFVHYVEV